MFDLSVIIFSVNWWNTLHQPAAVFRVDGPAILPALLGPLMIMALGFSFLFFTPHIAAMRNEIWARRIAAMRRLAARQTGDA